LRSEVLPEALAVDLALALAGAQDYARHRALPPSRRLILNRFRHGVSRRSSTCPPSASWSALSPPAAALRADAPHRGKPSASRTDACPAATWAACPPPPPESRLRDASPASPAAC